MYRRNIIKLRSGNNLNPKFIPIIFLIVAIILSVAGAITLSYQKIKSYSCTESVTATVIENLPEKSEIKRKNKRRHISIVYRPRFIYTYNGIEYDVVSNTASNPPKFEIGDIVELKINPENPRKFYVPSDKTTNFIGIIFLVVSGVFFIVFIIIYVSVSRNNNKEIR